MTNASNDPSVRPTNRVDRDTSPATEFMGLYAAKAPESTASGRTGTPGPERVPGRVGPRRLERLARDLTNRERAVLHDIDRFRFLTTGQLQQLHFYDHRTLDAGARVCRSVLYRLSRFGVIEHLDRRVGGIRAGSASYVWRIGPIGDRLLRESDQPRARRKEPSVRLLDHTLAGSDCIVRLAVAERTEPFELLSVESEPATWRSYLVAGAVTETLKPDLFIVTASGEYEDHWFIEVDRGTESVPTVLKKCGQYGRYRRTGKAQANGGVFPRVIWLVPDEHRLAKLRSALAADRTIDRDIFTVITAETLVPLVTGGNS